MDEKSDGYQKQETNLDHYRDEVLENCMWNLALVNGRPRRCNLTRCSDCEFNKKDQPKECRKRRIEWLKQKHIKPACKLTQFEIDLLQCYASEYRFKDLRLLILIKGKGYFKGVDEDATIEDILTTCEITEED